MFQPPQPSEYEKELKRIEEEYRIEKELKARKLLKLLVEESATVSDLYTKLAPLESGYGTSPMSEIARVARKIYEEETPV